MPLPGCSRADLLRHLGAHHVKGTSSFSRIRGEYLLCKPQDRVRIGRMGKAAYKQEASRFAKSMSMFSRNVSYTYAVMAFTGSSGFTAWMASSST